jgi:LuxR family maltose regulon positive regulatory protein
MSATLFLRTRTIPRRRLLDALQRWPEMRLIRIVAPAGYGKSSLVAAWMQSLAALPEDQRPLVASLSLLSDIGAENYVRGLIDAQQPALPALQSILAPANSGEQSPTQSIAALCHELAAAPRAVVLVIDDVHLLTDPSLHALTQQLLDHAGDRLHLVLVSRTAPPLQITELVLADAALTLSERDLAFDHDEFIAFSQLVGIEAHPAALLDDLERRCSGWVTGLKLLSYDILHPLPGRVHAPASAFTSSSAEEAIRHFLEDRVLTQLATPLRDFALAAARMPWMSAALMAAVSDTPIEICAQRLVDLNAVIGFMTEFHVADETRYRFHPLFHDALRDIAVAHGPQHVERRRAAAWLVAHDDVDAALAALAPDIPASTIADDLAAAVHRAFLHFDLIAARRWLAALPADLLDSHAPLAVAAAWLAFLAESVPQLDAALPRAAAALRCAPRQDLLLDLAVLESYHFLLHARFDEAIRRLADAEALATPADSLGAGYLHFVRFLIPRTQHDIDARARELWPATDIFERIGFDYGVIQMMFAQKLLKQWFGDLRSALADSDFLQAFARSHDRSRHIAVQEDFRQRGEILYLLNRIDEARAIMQSIVASTECRDEALGNVHLVRTYLALCDFADGAHHPTSGQPHDTTWDDAEQWAQILASNYSGNLGYIAWPRILRDFRAGRLERCWQTIETLRLSLDDDSDQIHVTLRMAILGGAVLGRRTQPQLADHLDSFLESLDARGNRLTSQYVRLLRVLHALSLGQEPLALERLQDLLPHVEHSGALRILLDFPALQPLLQRCDSPFAERVLALFPQPAAANDFILTPQERRVLEQIAAGATTKQIAAAHTLSLKTIYSHMHNIFRKLGVHSRKEAVRVWTRSES